VNTSTASLVAGADSGSGSSSGSGSGGREGPVFVSAGGGCSIAYKYSLMSTGTQNAREYKPVEAAAAEEQQQPLLAPQLAQ
jgi:hypothetical protein